MTKLYRQGDVVFLRLDDKENVEVVKGIHTKPASTVLKEGEVTGHMHEATGTGVSVCTMPEDAPQRNPWREIGTLLTRHGIERTITDSTLYLTSANQIKVVHPEHGTLTLDAGHYLVFSQREYDEGRSRYVAD